MISGKFQVGDILSSKSNGFLWIVLDRKEDKDTGTGSYYCKALSNTSSVKRGTKYWFWDGGIYQSCELHTEYRFYKNLAGLV